MTSLVVFCDGTWNDPSHNTNVLRLRNALADRAPAGVGQIANYNKGVGTDWTTRLTGGMFGAGLSKDILRPYRWLTTTYRAGDALYFFGFSRGAFTARSLVGMIRNVGMLPATASDELLEEAFRLYKDHEIHPDSATAQQFRQQHAAVAIEHLHIAFLGVWDTVGALGVPVVGPRSFIARQRWEFHDLVLSSYVKRAAQALAIDEHRGAFLAAPWCAPDVDAAGESGQRTSRKSEQVVEQVWFAGCHGDIGGGRGQIALRWMMERAEAAGLAFEPMTGDLGEAPMDQSRHDSMSAIWRTSTGSVLRPLGHERFRDQSIHPSVERAYAGKPKPANLVAAEDGNPLDHPHVQARGFATWYYLQQYSGLCGEQRGSLWARLKGLVGR